MPGNSKTNSFLLSASTVMIGPQTDLWSLNSVSHSLGLIKNFVMQDDPQFVELTQGTRNQTAMIVRTADQIRCSFEVYEFTARNFGYAAGLGANTSVYDPKLAVNYLSTAQITAGATAIVTSGNQSQLTVGDFITIQNGFDDYCHIAKVTAETYAAGPNTHTITFAGHPIPTGVTFPIGSRVFETNRLMIGAQDSVPALCAKVIGTMPKDDRPIVLMFPKIQITKGFSINFNSDNFANMPFEFSPITLNPTDANYADFGDNVMAVFTAS